MGNVVIGVDHKWRDLPGYVYVKWLLENLGHKVYLVRNGFEEGCAVFHKADIIVYNHVYEDKRAKSIKKLSQFGIINVILPTEGIPTLVNTQILATGKYSDLSHVNRHFVWNEEMKRLMLENTNFPADDIYITGVPRFDFYKYPMNSLLMTKQEFKDKYNVDNDFPIISMATNFTNAGFYKQNEEFLEEDWKKLKVNKVLDSRECARRDYESREIFIESLIYLLTKLERINLVIKLHPSENHAYYYELLGGRLKPFRSRIRIIVQEYIWDVLNVTDVLLERSCTTGVEAWILDKPTIEMRLNPEEWYCSAEHAAGSNIVTAPEELLEMVVYYLKGGSISPDILEKRQDFLKKWCYQVDGHSSERFVTEIDHLMKNKTQSTEIRYDFGVLRNTLIYWLLRITDYKIHDWRVYGWKRTKDKLGRVDKYFHHCDEKLWYKKIKETLKY